METNPTKIDSTDLNSLPINGLLHKIRVYNEGSIDENKLAVEIQTTGADTARDARIHIKFHSHSAAGGIRLGNLTDETDWSIADVWTDADCEDDEVFAALELPNSSEKVVYGKTWIDRDRAHKLAPATFREDGSRKEECA